MGETLEQWRDRMNFEFEIPTRFAALNDLKLSEIEVANPFLAREILDVVRRLPDKLRTDKAMFREITVSRSPDIPIATRPATAGLTALLRPSSVRKHLREELSGNGAGEVLTKELQAHLLSTIQKWESGRTDAGGRYPYIKNKLTSVTNKIRSRLTIDQNMLVFRAYIVAKMHEMLKEDAASLRK